MNELEKLLHQKKVYMDKIREIEEDLANYLETVKQINKMIDRENEKQQPGLF